MKYKGEVELRILRSYVVDAEDEEQAFEELIAIAEDDPDGAFAEDFTIPDRDVYSLEVADDSE